MEAEVYSLQARNRGHRKASVTWSPTESCSVSVPQNLCHHVIFWISLYMCICMCVCVCVCVPSGFSRVQLFATLWTVTRQAPLSKGFFRQAYWTGFPCPPPEKSFWPRDRTRVSCTSCITGGFFTMEPLGKPQRNSVMPLLCRQRNRGPLKDRESPKASQKQSQDRGVGLLIYIYI